MDFFFEEHLRLDWGFGNPNKTAALIGTLILLVQVLRVHNKIARVGWIVATLLLGVCQVHTYSRGGLIATVAGLLIYWAIATRGRFGLASPGELWAIVGLLVSLMVYSALPHVEASKRYTQGWAPGTEEDRSITNRLRIWKDVPRMMRDAPGGWGAGKSGDAWTQYYQPAQTRYQYRTLVNSHLSWLVELGWLGRWAYLSAWGIVAALLWSLAMAERDKRRMAVVAATGGAWAVFGVSACFSSVAESAVICSLPIAMLVFLCWWEGKTFRACSSAKRAFARAGGGVLIGSACLLLTTFIVGKAKAEEQAIRYHRGVVWIGSSPFRYALCASERRVVGKHFGMLIREHAKSGWAVCESIDDVGSIEEVPVIVQSGNVIGDGPMRRNGREFVLLNPLRLPQGSGGQQVAGIAILGELRRDRTAFAYRQLAKTSPGLSVKVVPGADLYLPDWVRTVETAVPDQPPR